MLKLHLIGRSTIHLTGMINLHPNITQFYGVMELKDVKRTEDKFHSTPSLLPQHYILKVEKYLRDNAITFEWESQLKLAKEISSAFEIIHGDLIIMCY
ncbi:hypothetical protein RhiirA4_466327 [Rhizophagus irregularis]|uniref:Uncharacterized protein n=1 Tax=Rhizophagus irregularis TaxID=588596 RepID=A0A2I1GTU4_9GLOM|nr:hypothetical protein RhiirA4_466327 [Rhizophagus irregularis]